MGDRNQVNSKTAGATQQRGASTRCSFEVIIETPIRLDVLVADTMAKELGALALSRSQIKKEIEAGAVGFNGRVISSPGVKIVRSGVLTFNSYQADKLVYQPDPSIEVIHEDAALIVINKPAGLSVHPGAGRKDATLVNKLLPKLAGTDPIRPGIVHRLDKDTTGLLVVAKTVQAHGALARQFADHSIVRRYEALVFATPKNRKLVMSQDSGTIDANLLRVEKKIIIDGNGRRAVTHWSVIERLGYGAIVEFRLETGRTHQIRVHAASIKCPVIGDRTYGDFSGLPMPLFKAHHAFGRQALHARKLGFAHPSTGKEMVFEVAPPAEHLQLVERFRDFGTGNGALVEEELA